MYNAHSGPVVYSPAPPKPENIVSLMQISASSDEFTLKDSVVIKIFSPAGIEDPVRLNPTTTPVSELEET